MIKATYSGQGESRKLNLDIDNGDLQALTDALKQYGFVNEQAMLRYALVALLRSEDNTLYIKDGERVASLKINENLLKAHPADTGSDTTDGNAPT